MNNRIKEIRKALALNQQEFGRRIGVRQGTVAGYETGSRTPLDAVVNSICREFNVSEDWLRTGEGEMFSQAVKKDEVAALVENVLSKRFEQLKAEIMQSLDGLTDEELETIGKVFDKLSETKKE